MVAAKVASRRQHDLRDLLRWHQRARLQFSCLRPQWCSSSVSSSL